MLTGSRPTQDAEPDEVPDARRVCAGEVGSGRQAPEAGRLAGRGALPAHPHLRRRYQFPAPVVAGEGHMLRLAR